MVREDAVGSTDEVRAAGAVRRAAEQLAAGAGDPRERRRYAGLASRLAAGGGMPVFALGDGATSSIASMLKVAAVDLGDTGAVGVARMLLRALPWL